MAEGRKDGGTATRAPFGTLPDGRLVEAITLAHGDLSATIISYGAAIQAVIVPDRDGVSTDLALGHAKLQPYLDQPQYFGATVGRYANRIAGGRFTLDGVAYRVPPNNGSNALHGGAEGFDKRVWQVRETRQGKVAGVTFGLVSPDGDQGFPGTVEVTAAYSLAADGTLAVEYRAETDRPTLVNLSNHAYWNLGGEGSGTVEDHELAIFADHFLPTDAGAIPTGAFRAVEGTPFDFRVPTPIGAHLRDADDEQLCFGRGYDHNWVIARQPARRVRLVARVRHPGSGRTMEVLSDQPGLQFYSGNFLDGVTAGKRARSYRMGDAFALEPQLFPDTPNRPAFGSARLAPGSVYRSRIRWRFSKS